MGGIRGTIRRRASLVVLTWSAILLAGIPAAHSASVTPRTVEHGKCMENGPWTELKLEPVANGTFSAGDLQVTVFGYDGKTFSFSSNVGVDAVTVKGDENNARHGYFYGSEVLGDVDLRAPLKNGNLQRIENARFCFDLDDQTPLDNPPLPDQCGLDIALILDVSGSIDQEELAFYKEAAKDYVDAVAGSPSRVSLTSFAAEASRLIDFTDVMDPAGAQQVKDAIDGLTTGGNTNWDHAFRVNDPDQAEVAMADLAIIITDGKPTTWANPSVGRAEEDALRAGVRSANGLKEDGTRIVAVGVSFDRDVFVDRIIQISGPVEDSDYYRADSFDLLAEKLAQAAPESCGSGVSITKLVDGQAAAGWEFSSSATPEGDNPTTTGEDGTTAFTYDNVETLETDITETVQDGYSFVGASCTLDGEPFETGSIENGIRITLEVGQFIDCTFDNETDQPESPLLTLSKSADQTSVDLTDGDTSNDTITYTITIENEGTGPGSTGPIVDDYDQDHATISNISDDGVDDGGTITWPGVTVAAGASVSVTYDATIHGPFADDAARCESSDAFAVLNSVEVDDLQASEEVCVGAGPAISLTKSADQTSVDLTDGDTSNDSVTYTVTVENVGSTSGTTGDIVDDYDEVHATVTAVNDGGTDDGDTITWAGVTLAPGESVDFTYSVTIHGPFADDAPRCEGGTAFAVLNSVTVDDASTSEEVCVTAGPDFTVEKTASSTQIDLTDGDPSNDSVTYTITITNAGSASGTSDAVVDDYDQTHVTVSDISHAGSDDGDAITWAGQTLAAGDSVSLTYTATFHGPFTQDAPRCGETDAFSVLNTVTVGDATADEEACVTAGPAGSVDKEVRVLPDGTFGVSAIGEPGATLEYRITYTNHGEAEATGVVITDPVPDHSTFLSCEPMLSCEQSEGTITWSIGSVPSKDAVAVTFQVQLDEVFPIGITTVRNTALAVSDQEGTTPSNEVLVRVTRFEKASCPDDQVVPGGFITYSLPWAVNGGDVTGVTIEERLPAGVEFVSADPAPTSTDPLRWELGDLSDGASGEVTIIARAPSDVADGTVLVNEADLYADGIPATTAIDEVTVTVANAAVDARAFGARVELLVTEVLGATPDTDPSGDPDTLLEVPAPPALDAKVLDVQEGTNITSMESTANAIATTGAVKILQDGADWLVTADAVRAVSSSSASGVTAGSSSAGSVLANVTVAGQNIGTVTEPTSFTVVDPVLGTTTTISLLEKVETGAAAGEDQPADGLFRSGLTVNAIHVVVEDADGDVQVDVTVAQASSSAQFQSGLVCDRGVPHVSGSGFALWTTIDETLLDGDDILEDGGIARVLLPSLGGEDTSTLAHVGPVTNAGATIVESNAAFAHTVGSTDIGADTADSFTEAQIEDLDLLQQGEDFLLTADLIRAEASASASGAPSATASGSTTLADVVLAGTNVCEALSLDSICTPEPNTVLPSASNVLVILNEQIVGPSGDAMADLTVNAIHIYILGQGNPFNLPVGAEIIVASAHADARAADAVPASEGDETAPATRTATAATQVEPLVDRRPAIRPAGKPAPAQVPRGEQDQAPRVPHVRPGELPLGL